MNEALTFSQGCPSSYGSTENRSSPAPTRAQDNNHTDPESQESDLLSGAEHKQPPETSSVGGLVDLERASMRGSIVLSSTNDSHSTILSTHPHANDEETSDIESCAHSQVLANGNSASESTGIDISADQITNADSNKSQANSHERQEKLSPRWKPLVLRRLVLLGFSGLLLAIIAGLEVLSYVSNHSQGLATVVETRYYLWKFGPTFVFTMLATFWTNVEYRTKQIMPWMIMVKNRSGSYGSEGFTLNYLTLSTPGALYKALKSRHFPVAIGMFGTLALKLVVILSTGLLIAKDQAMTTQIDILALDKFDLGKNSSAAAKQFSSLRILLAIHAYGLPYPSGTNLDFASQSFLPLRQAKNGDVSTEAEVFEASLKDCMVFNQTYDYYDYWAADFSRTLFPANIANRLFSFCSNEIPAADLIASEPWEENLHVLTPCSNMSSENDSHWVFIAIPFAVPEIGFQWSGVACQPAYSLSRRRVAGATSSSSVFQLGSVSENASETLQLGLSPVELTSMFVSELDVLDVAAYMFNDLDSTIPNSSFSLVLSRYLLYCLNITSPKSRPLDFANTKTLQNSFEQFFRSTMALYVRSHYSVPLNSTTNGTFTSAVSRLYVGEWSLRFMEGFLGLLFILSILLLFYKCPLFLQDPAPLAVQTIFLAKNLHLEADLKRIGKLSNESPRWPFPRDSFYYFVEDGIRTGQPSRNPTLSTSTYGSLHVNTNSSNDPKEHFERSNGWRQMTASWAYRAAVLAFTVLLITFLEASFRISTKYKGLSEISNPSLENYAWLYLPSLIMAGISFAYSSLDCTARILHPFQKLNNGSITIKELFWEPIGAFTIQAIMQSARRHHFALTMILFTSILSPTLTIITTGLFTTRTIPYHGQVSFSVLDWFAIEKLHSTDADAAYSISEGQHVSNAIEFGNLTFPQWTHEDLLFPQIRLDIDQVEGVQGVANSMAARLPSIRPQMNCTVRGIWDQAPYNDSTFTITSLPECLDKGPTMSLCSSVWIMSPPYASYFASIVHTTEEALHPGSTAGCIDTRTDKWFAVARVGHDVLQDVSLIQCTPYIETLHTVVNFTLPNYTVELSQGQPRPDAPHSEIRVSTITFLFDGPSTSSNESIDIFFKSVFYGKDGIPPEELLGRASTDRLISQMQRVYGRVMVQILNDYRCPITPNISVALSGLLDPSTFNATVFTCQQRLVQNALATRILEGILGTMALCAAIHFALTPKTHLLPYDPGSVAAKMKLFAGSRLVRMIRERNGELDDELLGEVLSLGWWDEEEDEAARSETGERKRRFGIDVGVAAKEE